MAGPTHFVPASSGPPLVENGVVNSSVAGPSGAQTAGTWISIDYRLSAPGLPSGQTLQVRVPGLEALFPTSSGFYHLYGLAANLSVPSGVNVTSTENVTSQLAVGTTFNASTNAQLSSQGFAMMATGSTGPTPVALSWRWALTHPNGLVLDGNWSKSDAINPAQFAAVAHSPPSSIPEGGAYPICLSGPIGNRTFSVHFSMTDPFQTFSGPSVQVPAGESGTFCWNTSAPSGVAAQTASIHLWEYGPPTYLLYQLSVVLTNSSGPVHGANGGAIGAAAYYVVLAVAIVGLLAVAVVAISRRRPPTSHSNFPTYIPRGGAPPTPSEPGSPPPR